jgi:parallel beta-helix repeat protein
MLMKTPRVAFLIHLAGSLGLLAQGALTPPGAPAPMMKTLQQIEPRFPISVIPTNLTVPGSYYVTTNLTGLANASGITMSTSNITVDLNGFSLTGAAGSQDGIVASSAANIVVRNGTVRNWGGYGLSAFVNNARVEHVNVLQNGTNGLRVGAGSVVLNCEAFGNGGAGIQALNDSSVIGCTSNDNGREGYLGSGVFLDCVAVQNGSSGFLGGGSFGRCKASENGRTVTGNGFGLSSASVITASVADRNAGSGISAANDNCIIKDCTAVGNTNSGILVSGTSATIKDCTAESNGRHGIESGGRCVISHCTVTGNATNGIVGGTGAHISDCLAGVSGSHGITAGSGATIKNCTVQFNTLNGISVTSDTLVRENVCYSNGNGGDGAGIVVSGNRNRIEGNNCSNNDRGIDVNSTGNLIIANSAAGNTTNYDIIAGNRTGTIITTEAAMNVATNSLINISY